jgi:GTP-binding nuclear protein Ran
MNTKVIVVGAGGVGKTSFVRRIKDDKFDSKYIATIGAEVTEYQHLKLWDTAGQEKFGGLRDGYYIGANYAIVMFDITSSPSLRSAVTYIKSIKRVCENSCKIILVSNKSDSIDEKIGDNVVTYVMNKVGNIETYIKISSKDGTNCSNVIDFIQNLEDEGIPADV